jgi:hypothetical protein
MSMKNESVQNLMVDVASAIHAGIDVKNSPLYAPMIAELSRRGIDNHKFKLIMENFDESHHIPDWDALEELMKSPEWNDEEYWRSLPYYENESDQE